MKVIIGWLAWCHPLVLWTSHGFVVFACVTMQAPHRTNVGWVSKVWVHCFLVMHRCIWLILMELAPKLTTKTALSIE